jgi:hypothetical protein
MPGAQAGVLGTPGDPLLSVRIKLVLLWPEKC